MAATARLNLQIDQFRANYREATKEARAQNDIMRREARGLGGALGEGARGMAGQMAGMLGLGAGIAGIGVAVKQASQWGDEIGHLSRQLNESVEAIQRVDYAAKLASNSGVEQISKAMLKLEAGLGDVANNRVSTALDRIGISARDLVGLPLDQKILALSEAFQRARRDGAGVADAKALLGREAGELIPLLNLSKEALESMFSDAPALAEDSIKRLAELNDEFDSMIMKSKAFTAERVSAVAEMGRMIGDLFTKGFDGMAVAAYERSVDADVSAAARSSAREQQAEAIERLRAEEQAAKQREQAAKEEAAAAEKLATLKEQLEKMDFDLLPDDEKIAALKDKLDRALGDTVGLFALNFDESIEGLEALAKAREAQGDQLPSSGTNSAAEAYEWLKQARDLQQERQRLEQAAADRERAAADNLAAELDKAREEADKGAFALLSPEEQAAALRDQLSKSFDFDISGAADVERGLQEARARVLEAREAGDGEGEQAALAALIEAQNAARDFAALQTGGGERDIVDGRGTVAGAIANIFGRSSADLQLDEAKHQTGILANIERVLRDIQASEQRDELELQFTRGRNRYPTF